MTGADINEGSLGTVPTAGSAQPSGSAGGDLAGSYPNPSVGANKINSANVVNNSLARDDLGPGSVVVLPANWVHVSGCRAGSDCVFYQEGKGKFDFKPAAGESSSK